jgi:cytochrome P450
MISADEIAIPDHVAPESVFDFDIARDPLLIGEPHSGLFELQKQAPEVFYTPRYGGHWIIQSRDAIFEASQDHEMFRSGGNDRVLLPISSNPPEHGAYRKILLQAFSPKNVNAMLPMIRSMAVDLVSNVADRGACEFVAEVSEPMPVIVFMKMLGLPLELMTPLRKLIIAALEEGDPHTRNDIFDQQLVMLDPVIRDRMEKPAGDMLSHIASSEIDGRKPSFDEMQRYLLLLTNAGLDTVVNAMSFSVLHLARNPALQEKLRGNPALIADAVEEFLRRYAPSTIGRVVAQDANFRGVNLRAGDRVLLLLPAANLDAQAYPDPDDIVLRRNVPPMTFGTGIHRCLGSHLARLELRVLLTEWLTRIPPFSLDQQSPPQMHAGMVYTVDKLFLRWDPAKITAIREKVA